MSYIFPLEAEEDIGNFALSGSCTVWETVPENKTKIIRTDQDWGVLFNWTTSGLMAASLSGKWWVHVYLELMGPGEGPGVAPKDENYVTTALPQNYSKIITIPKNTVPPGLYKITAAITMTGPPPMQAPTPIAMMGEGPLIQVYNVQI